MEPASNDLNDNQSRHERTIVFVYGSLKRGYVLHHLLASQRSLGPAVTKAFYRLFDLGAYPGLIEWPEGLAVHGEAYQVDSKCLCRLDDAEGVAEGLYVRRPVLLQSPFNSEIVHAWFWLNPVNGMRDCGASWP